MSANLGGCVRLMIDGMVRSSAGEYHSTSMIPFERGGHAELGSVERPRLTVAIE